MIPGFFRNYRTAKKGEGTCAECKYSIPPFWYSKRIRCKSDRHSQAVGGTKTCDRFKGKDSRDEGEIDNLTFECKT